MADLSLQKKNISQQVARNLTQLIKRMKTTVLMSFLCFLFFLEAGCGQQEVTEKQNVIDSLKTRLEQLKPGLGEFMTQIKYHHDELGKSIKNKDFERSAYEVDEIKEITDKIKQLQITNDKLTQPFVVFFDKYLQAPLASLADAAAKKDNASLLVNFTALTNNCNSCHQENNMRFMHINY
jgi:hypothetical protein